MAAVVQAAAVRIFAEVKSNIKYIRIRLFQKVNINLR